MTHNIIKHFMTSHYQISTGRLSNDNFIIQKARVFYKSVKLTFEKN